MKICIITQPLKSNYGGLIQAYALQHTLKKMGHQVVTARDSVVRKRFNIKPIYFIYYAYKRYLRGDRRFNPYRFMFKRFGHNIEEQERYATQQCQDFTEQYISTIELFTHPREIIAKYDAVIVGSDQVWRAEYAYPPTYFLDFTAGINIKRLAYAASFGLSSLDGYSPKMIEQCHALAQQFDAISVREKSAIELCSKYLGVTSTLIADPVVLLTPAEYDTLIGDNTSEPALVSYILDSSPTKQAICEQVESLTSLKVKALAPEKRLNEKWENIDQCRFCAPQEWLASLRTAKFVVTDSFHGALFAIMFEREFVVIDNSERGSERFNSLLESLSLEDRRVSSPKDITHALTSQKIDYKRVNSIIETMRTTAKEWLKEQIEK